MKYDELNLQKLRELPIFDVCTKLGITLYGMGPITKRAKCWYHDDQHPSMHVNKKKNIFKCFVCGKGGDVIRLVQHHPTWVHTLMKDKLPANYEFQPCLFGLHLLTNTNLTNNTNKKFSNSQILDSEKKDSLDSCNSCSKGVCIVESEKSAVILSEKFPDFVWLSCGGLQSFKPHLLAPLVHYKVIIFPDTDPTGDAFRQWCQVASEAQHLYKFRYPLRVSPLLETHATLDQKQRKIDLVDYLFCVQTP